MTQRLWLWLAFLGAVSGGVSRVIDSCQRVGAALAFRGGAGGSRDAGATDANVQRYVDELPDCAVWVYWLPHQLDGQVELLKRFHGLGVKRLILNPEVEFKPRSSVNPKGLAAGIDGNAVARAHVERLRREFPECVIDYAPFAFARYHADYPYPGFSGLDHSIAQWYPHEFGGPEPATHAARYVEQLAWARARWPELRAQSWIAMGDLYGSALGNVWKMAARPPRAWSRDAFDVWVEVSRFDVERHLYTLDAALAEGQPWRDLVAWHDEQSTAGRTRPTLFDERPFEQPINSAADVVNDLFGYRPRPHELWGDEPIVEPTADEVAFFSRYRGGDYQQQAA